MSELSGLSQYRVSVFSICVRALSVVWVTLCEEFNEMDLKGGGHDLT